MVAQREANALSAHVNASENRLTERYQEMSQAYRKADLSSGKAGAAATRKAQRLQEQVEAIMLERRNDPLVQRWERATDITHAFREKYYGSSMARTVRERPLRMLAQRERQADARRGGVPRGVFGDPFLRTTFAQPIRAFL